MKYTDHFNTKQTPQSEAIPGSSQVPNSAGGFAWEVSPWNLLNRFLILGSEGGTYYIGEKKLTKDNATNVIKCIQEDGPRVVNTIVEVSDGGKAPKNDPAIFALALACTFGGEKTKIAAYAAITKVCRIGTHLYTFCENIQALRGWSRGLRNGVAKFYTNRKPDAVAMQLIKYRQRNGWTHKDVLRLAHPTATDADLNNLLRYAVGKEPTAQHPLIAAFEEVQTCKVADKKRVEALIREFKLPREALPTELLNEVSIWEALLEEMPMTAMVRNLGKMTNVGLLKTGFDANVKKIVQQLGDATELKKARVHPLALLTAMKTYAKGSGDKGSLVWTPVQQVVDSLSEAFYLAFDAVEPTNQNWQLCLDVSSSMTWGTIAGMGLTPREGSAAMALVTAATEKSHYIMGFSNTLQEIKISPKQRLDDVIKTIERIPMGSTNCSLPMIHALEKKLEVDTFVVYTDSETQTGGIHPKQALDQYRQKMGRDAKLVVVGMVANNFTIADPKDRGMLDVIGFDTAAPAVMAEFSKGKV